MTLLNGHFANGRGNPLDRHHEKPVSDLLRAGLTSQYIDRLVRCRCVNGRIARWSKYRRRRIDRQTAK
jgi:hypothetical protein